MKLFLSYPRGFCAGVIRAIATVDKALKIWGSPIYVKHEIVHNRHVVEELKKKGALFVEDIREVPKNSKIIYSAHGVISEDRKIAKELNLFEIDATCILVEKNHNLVKNFAKKGYKIILIGKKTHVEVIGIASEAFSSVFVVEGLEDVEKLKIKENEKIFYLAQTTLSEDFFYHIVEAIKKKYPFCETFKTSSICYATLNRQRAFKKILDKVDLSIVVGDKKSSNSNRLKELALKKNIPSYLINCEDEIEEKWLKNIKNIGMTSGASTPENIVKGSIKRLKSFGVKEVEEILYVEEEKKFPLPKEISQAVF